MAMSIRALGAAVLVLALGVAAPRARAADLDPAAVQIQSFDNALIEVMKQAKSLGAGGRARKLAPAIDQTFDIAAMTRFAVGPAWTGMSDADHTALIEAFKRFTAASYAHNFDGYSGQKFDVDPNVVVRGPDKIVQSHIKSPGDDPVAISYRMRATTGAWKIIDVYYQGTISQLTTRRSDFAATVASGGAKALIAHLDAQTEKLLR
jgi:phospholipid transport system substrate-binding protein